MLVQLKGLRLNRPTESPLCREIKGKTVSDNPLQFIRINLSIEGIVVIHL